MKRALLFFLLVTASAIGLAQQPEPVKWSFSAKKIAGNKFEIHLAATIDKGWHIYSQTTPEGGPVRTTVSFGKNPLVSLQGSTAEIGKREEHFDELFGVEVKQFSDKVDFVQVVAVKGKITTNLSGAVEFMICNDNMCLPPRSQPFNISLK